MSRDFQTAGHFHFGSVFEGTFSREAVGAEAGDKISKIYMSGSFLIHQNISTLPIYSIRRRVGRGLNTDRS